MGTVTPIKAIDEAIVPFPPTEVWRVLADIAAYPDWWPRHLGLRVVHRERGLVGSEVEQRPFGGRPLRCRVEAVEEPFSIRTRYHGGFIEGRGEFRLESVGSGTRVRYELDVHAEGRAVACLGRILPLGRIHSRLMLSVFRQLERVLMQGKAASSPRKEGGAGF
jgi:uncharacterized protein YndB with AHSA1/START domain